MRGVGSEGNGAFEVGAGLREAIQLKKNSTEFELGAW